MRAKPCNCAEMLDLPSTDPPESLKSTLVAFGNFQLIPYLLREFRLQRKVEVS